MSGPNPYVAPRAEPKEPSPVAPRTANAALLAAALGVLGGGALAMQASWGLSRFGGLEYVPRLVVLAATRALAGGPAALAASLVAIGALHRSRVPRAATPPPPAVSRTWPFVATLASAIPSYVGLILGGIAISAADGLPASLYAEAARAGLRPGDALVGLAHVLVDAALAAAMVRVGERAWRSSAWSLAGKRAVAFMVLPALTTAGSTLVSSLLGGV